MISPAAPRASPRRRLTSTRGAYQKRRSLSAFKPTATFRRRSLFENEMIALPILVKARIAVNQNVGNAGQQNRKTGGEMVCHDPVHSRAESGAENCSAWQRPLLEIRQCFNKTGRYQYAVFAGRTSWAELEEEFSIARKVIRSMSLR